jgi:hypothetical protein
MTVRKLALNLEKILGTCKGLTCEKASDEVNEVHGQMRQVRQSLLLHFLADAHGPAQEERLVFLVSVLAHIPDHMNWTVS